MRQVVYVSGTRADFGLMVNVLKHGQASGGLQVSVCVTGMHLLKEYGYTVSEIEASGLPIHSRIPVILDGSTGRMMARALGDEIIGMSEAFAQGRPDAVLVLGDRGEMLAAATTAVYLNIPVVHLHGGERSGSVDEPIRHAISKLAHYHFVSTSAARKRLIRMGERPDSIFVTGAPGLDKLHELVVKMKPELCAAVGLEAARPVALVLFHPVAQEAQLAGSQIEEVLEGICSCGIQLLCLRPNSDAGGRQINGVLDRYRHHRDIRILVHLPRADYVSWMAAADVMVGNSSSGIIEAATLDLPVVNVGSRQQQRERSGNVLDIPVERTAIAAAVRRVLSGDFAGPWDNAYGDGRTYERIVELLCHLPLDQNVLRKINEY